MNEVNESEKIKGAVREAYGQTARRFSGEAVKTGCCGSAQAVQKVDQTAQSGGCCSPGKEEKSFNNSEKFYSTDETTGLPESVTGASLGCGNPTAIAELKPGETVLDLGSGGGIDCFLAAKQVGPTGRVIGLDMTPDMIHLAQRNAKKVGATNVEFRLGEIENNPLPDASVDVIISNCVINLSPDKDAVFAEALRVLRPGGRLMVSDIVIDGNLPEAIRSRMDAWAGCLAGALDESVYLGKIRNAGFDQVEVVSREYAMISEEASAAEERKMLLDAGLTTTDLDTKVASVRVKAIKP